MRRDVLRLVRNVGLLTFSLDPYRLRLHLANHEFGADGYAVVTLGLGDVVQQLKGLLTIHQRSVIRRFLTLQLGP